MSTYVGRVALVTGASQGIGAAITTELVKAGLIVVGAARRVDKIEALAERLSGEPGRLVPRKLDMSKEDEIKDTFEWIEKELGGVDVLVNNAAVTTQIPMHELPPEEIKFITDVNQIGVILAAREAFQGYLRRNIDDGYIININSFLGHKVMFMPKISVGLYCATKFAITAVCQALRQDAKNAGIGVRVTSICPGSVRTDMIGDFPPEMLTGPQLNPEEVARMISFVLSLPKTSEVTELAIHPTGEVF